ncbi:hypothetical protein [Kitasatospora sp. NPDC004531]
MSKTLTARLAALFAVTALALAFGPLATTSHAGTVEAARVGVVVSDDPGAGGCC